MCIEKLKNCKKTIISLCEFLFFKLKQITWGKAIKWITSHHIPEYTIVSVLIIYTITTYENILLNWYDENVIKYLAIIVPNIWLNIACILFFIFIIGLLIYRFTNRFIYDNKIIYVLTVITSLFFYYNRLNRYTFFNFSGIEISYIKTIAILSILFILAAIINIGRKLFSSIKDQWNSYQKKQNENNKKFLILDDRPIKSASEDDDLLKLDGEALKIADEIKQLEKSKTWSLAITAPWGTGKTSFINMVIDNLKKSDDHFEFVYFNPRNSQSYQSIQEDFFTTITNILSKYDYRCNSLMKDYMASLQLIDNREIIEKLVNWYKIWDKTDLIDKLSNVFDKLPKKILVIIDDFDRLSKEEIMEVLKLIDSNAAFKNLIFLTAYDKEQVNKSLGDSYKTKDACFVDKFFNLEFSIPQRPYKYIIDFIVKNLCNRMSTDEIEITYAIDSIKEDINIQLFIPTLRDAKRFINLVTLDYKNVQDEVIIEEYLLIQLIKYKYPEKYKNLYDKKYLTKDFSYDIWYLKDIKEEETNTDILSVLKLLFPDSSSQDTEKELRKNKYRHIYNKESFNYYFENDIYGSLKIKEMKVVFEKPIDTVFTVIDNWLKEKNTASDFVEYLNDFNIEYLEDPKLTRYAEIVTYIATKYYSRYSTTGLIWNLINIKNYADDGANYFVLDEHHNELKDIILNGIFNAEYDNKYLLARHLHNSFVTDNLKKEDYWITDDDIWPSLKEKFLSLFDTLEESELYDWLLNCFVNFDKFKSPAVTFDPDCISKYKKHINEDPDFYLSGFVSNSINSINCRSTWRHLFKDEVEFEAWLDTYKEKYPLAYNFWKLYKDNNYEIIYYYYEEDIKKMLNNNLVEQVKILEKLHKIEREFINIPDYKDDMDIDEKKKQHEKLVDLCLEFRNIKLNIDIKFYHILHKKLDAKFAKYHLPLGSRIPQ
ncbi:MAG: P-loop NTPase fold protein [Bacteroidales bacterium]|nr:P-loop NTPase fold protein [Bacteroidales bacterium]